MRRQTDRVTSVQGDVMQECVKTQEGECVRVCDCVFFVVFFACEGVYF